MKELQKLNKYFFIYKRHFILGIIITIVSQIFMVIAPEFVGKSINVLKLFLNGEVEPEWAKSELWKYFFYILGTTLLSGFLTFWMRQTLIVMSRHVEFDMKNDIFKQYQQLPLQFYKKQRTGDLMSRISEDVGKVRQYVGPAVMYSINTAVRMTVVLIQMFIISPKLSWYALIPVPILAIIMYKLTNAIKNRSLAYQVNLSKLSTFSQEIFSGIRVIKAYAHERKTIGNYNQLSEDSKTIYMRLAKANALMGPLMVGLIGLSNIFVIYIGSKMYLDGMISDIGIIAQFIMYINLLTWPIASLGWVASMVQEAEASQKRINEFLNEKSDITNIPNAYTTKIIGKIAFKNVDYVYDDTGIEALKNVNFDIKEGETLGIVGATGSGKSTILHLINRLFDPAEGAIEIDDMNIKNYAINHLRKSVATVPQDAFLFSDTIYNNIKYGNEYASVTEIYEAARLADIHDTIINFKNGYNTILGERGLTLSGGQKQRISLARAILKNAQILLLDDSLSAVDTETEETILNNLKNILTHKTAIIVSHRISSIKNADKIIVLENGKIIESGSHYELIEKDGEYANLYKKQLTEKDN